ncbi:MAG: sodium-dependent transporter [Bacteriovoracaceae bacterium]|nr:sodium-dependent transporter [Bacteriovoracaceae bacterium]
MARERWDKRSAFLMAAIGSAIGLGNVWRFPYMAYSNGGGAFFIPYIIALITTGVPLVALEYYLGVRSQKGPTEAYGMVNDRSNYIGWISLAVASMITIYYTVIMGWAWNYLYHSFGVSWAGREGSFFYKNILGLSSGIGVLGGIQWPIVLGNFLTWLAVFFIIFKGVGVVGKVVTWTVGLPWLLLLILIIRGVTLKGAAGGLNYYLTPDFAKLLDPGVWLAAYGQIFFSLSLGFGVMIAYASYLPRESDINTNAWVVSFANCLTSFLAGFAIFSVLGYLAVSTNQPIDQVAKGGPGLAFIIYPTAISILPGGAMSQSIFAVLFFFMLLTLGIDSAFSLVEGIVTSLRDSLNIKRETTAFWVCVVGFLAGTLFTTQAGLYWLDLIDHWMNWGLVIVGLLEAILIGWFVDIRRVVKDMDSTSEIELRGFWIFCVKYITPVALILTIITSIIKEVQTPYEGYPIWALMTGGWFLLISSIYLSFILENYEDGLTKIKSRYIKFGGWIVSYVGLMWTFYQFYQSGNKILPIVYLIVFSGIGLFTFFFKQRRDV